MLIVTVREWELLDDSPMRKVRRLTEPRGRVRFLSDAKRRRLLDECQASRNPYLHIVVILALSTRAQKMELFSLTWRDVDLQQGMIHLQQTEERRPLYARADWLHAGVDVQHATIRRPDCDLT
jgi:integrase